RNRSVHPGVVTRLRTSGVLDVPQLWSGKLIERPAFGAMRARRSRPIQDLAFPPVKATKMPARKRYPEHAVVIDVSAARSEARRWHFVDFTKRGLRGIRSRLNPNDLTGISHHGSPHRTVGGTDADGVYVYQNPFVLCGIDRLIGLYVCVTLAVAVRVEDEWRPALRFHFIACLLKHFPIEPTDLTGAGQSAANPERLI